MKKKEVSGPSTPFNKRKAPIINPSPPEKKQSLKSVPLSSKSVRSKILPVNEENKVMQYVVIPPDGGWGWVIVVIAFISYFLMDGVCYTFGIFLGEIAETFDMHTSEVAIISSLMTGVYYFTGPVACALCNKFGFRNVAFVGALSATALFLGASFVENFILFAFLIGVCVGFCFDLVYTVMLLDVGFYFEKYRALATALSVIGVSAGIMGFPPIFTESTLLGSFHWRTKFRFISGSFLILTFLTLALKPIKPTLIIEAVERQESEDSIGTFYIEESETGIQLGKIFDQFHNLTYPKISEYTNDFVIASHSEEQSMYMPLNPESDNESAPKSFYQNVSLKSSRLSDYPITTVIHEEVGCCPCCPSTCCRSTCFKTCCRKCQRTWNSCWSFLCCSHRNIARPMYRDDIMYQFGSLSMLPEYKQSHGNVTLMSIGSHQTNINYHLSVSRVMTQKDVEEQRQCICCPEAVIRVIATMIDLSILKSASFCILCFSSFLTMLGLYAPFVFMVERGEELNLKDGWPTKLLSLMGLANLLGRVCCGLVSFWPALDPMVVSYITLIVGGALILISSFWVDLVGQCIAATVFGFCVVLPRYERCCWRICLVWET